ncbi:MAG: 4-(cytidine 5'-diphospho)-2-C-methyl-D-erythritol kinase [Gammaproteobacteria bacterium]
MDSLTLPAPAKLNLFLHVTGRRPDGYHELQSVFQFVDLADEIRLAPHPDSILREGGLPGLAPEDDLVVRAAQLLRNHTNTTQGARIGVSKRIPDGGGLGGGSSDAATVLLGLNHLWGLGLSLDELAGLGLELGADVPVFIRGFAAWAEGVGEHLQPIHLPEPAYLIVHPGVFVSTVSVFKHAELTRNTPPITIRAFRSGAGANDLEKVARKLEPEVGEAMDWLMAFAPAAMTGSGACVFAPFDSEEQAKKAAEQLPKPGWRAFVARGLNRSPVHEALGIAID